MTDIESRNEMEGDVEGVNDNTGVSDSSTVESSSSESENTESDRESDTEIESSKAESGKYEELDSDDEEELNSDDEEELQSEDEEESVSNDEEESTEEDTEPENNNFPDSSDNSSDEESDSSSEQSSHHPNSFLDSRMSNLISPLLPKRNMSSKDHLLATIAIAIRHNLDYETMMSLLRWTKTTLSCSDLPESKYQFWKTLNRDVSCFTRHYYCSICLDYIGKNEVAEYCICRKCGPDKCKKSLSYFIQLSVTSQIHDMLKDPVIVQSLRHRFERVKINEDAIEDVYDGKRYKHLASEGNFASYEYNLTLDLNLDGCSVSESSTLSAWLVYLGVNELPPHSRSRNMILAEVWVDKKHPVMNFLLKPLSIELKHLYTDGVKWMLDKNTEITTKVMVTSCCVDSKARAPLLNMTDVNGLYGCTFCYHPGENTPDNPLRRFYPLRLRKRVRNDEEMRRHMKQAYDSDKRVKGVKGPSVLLHFPGFDLRKGMSVDSMHNVYLGVTPHHTELILKVNVNGRLIGRNENLDIIDKRLLAIRPPSKLSRKPRSIRTRKSWKATEWRNWLLYYSLPCLDGLIPTEHLKILALLVQAIYILNKDSISPDDLQLARRFLNDYVTKFERKFGEEQMTYNMHLLDHLCDSVAEGGPLPRISAAPYESWNHKIIQKVSSSKGVQLQISVRFLLTKFVMRALIEADIATDTKKFVINLLKYLDINHQSNFFKKCGNAYVHQITDGEANALRTVGYLNVTEVEVFKKAIIKGLDYRSAEARDDTKFRNSIISFDHAEFGEIKKIIQFFWNDVRIQGLLVEPFRKKGPAYNALNRYKIERSNRLKFIDGREINAPAFLIKTLATQSVVALSNISESD